LNLLPNPYPGFEVLLWGFHVSVVVNPDKTGNNLSNKVLKNRKPSGAQVYVEQV
jgi:hypothetical protein